jgi:hypothetical protein
MRRFLRPGGAARSDKALLEAVPEGEELSLRERVSFLLHVDAEIEHCLMVQYLFAAYSLGGPQVPEHHRETVRGWQDTILGIAKEEMGHLVTVQNALRLIGAPLNFGREDFPWDVPFYPFPFALEPLTLKSVAKYVYAESAVDWKGALADEIGQLVKQEVQSPHRVSELFGALMPLIGRLPESAFQPETLRNQADFAEWGRGYQAGQRGNTTPHHARNTPDVLVVPLASRGDAVAALKAVAEQGEAPGPDADDERSHFSRFLKVYEGMKAAEREGWSPARPVATNPYVSLDPDLEQPGDAGADAGAALIVNREAVLWARLHNVRYRMLLTFLHHSFLLDGGADATVAFTPRGAVINATVGEMYNLRALSGLLMQLPLDPANPAAGNAGPPFQMPYTLDLPEGEGNRWRLYLDLLDAAVSLVGALEAVAEPARRHFLAALSDSDAQLRATVLRILAGRTARDQAN